LWVYKLGKRKSRTDIEDGKFKLKNRRRNKRVRKEKFGQDKRKSIGHKFGIGRKTSWALISLQI